MNKQIPIRSIITKFPKAADNGGSNFLTHTTDQLTTAILAAQRGDKHTETHLGTNIPECSPLETDFSVTEWGKKKSL